MPDLAIFPLVSFLEFIAVWYIELVIEMSLSVSIIMFVYIPWISRITPVLSFNVPILTFLCVFCLQSWDFDSYQLRVRCGLTFEYSCYVLLPVAHFALTWPSLFYLNGTLSNWRSQLLIISCPLTTTYISYWWFCANPSCCFVNIQFIE